MHYITFHFQLITGKSVPIFNTISTHGSDDTVHFSMIQCISMQPKAVLSQIRIERFAFRINQRYQMDFFSGFASSMKTKVVDLIIFDFNVSNSILCPITLIPFTCLHTK